MDPDVGRFRWHEFEHAFSILNVRSTHSHDDRSTAARIRDAAIGLFAERGVAATTVREIAEAAAVSPGLVIHHFGSKDALRAACDEHIAASLREQKAKGMQAASQEAFEALSAPAKAATEKAMASIKAA